MVGLVLIKFPFPQSALGAAEPELRGGLRFVTCRCDLVFSTRKLL